MTRRVLGGAESIVVARDGGCGDLSVLVHDAQAFVTLELMKEDRAQIAGRGSGAKCASAGACRRHTPGQACWNGRELAGGEGGVFLFRKGSRTTLGGSVQLPPCLASASKSRCDRARGSEEGYGLLKVACASVRPRLLAPAPVLLERSVSHRKFRNSRKLDALG